jgi:hypothetical protein
MLAIQYLFGIWVSGTLAGVKVKDDTFEASAPNGRLTLASAIVGLDRPSDFSRSARVVPVRFQLSYQQATKTPAWDALGPDISCPKDSRDPPRLLYTAISLIAP